MLHHVLFLLSTTLFLLTSANDYVSVRALDQFGNSVQLQHAREAAERHGRLVVAASADAAVVIVSVGNKPAVQSVTLPKLPGVADSGQVLAVCCTGIKGDAMWLVQQVQQYVTMVWERYNHHPPAPEAMAHFISRLLGSFQGDPEGEWTSSLERESHDWARPLGLQTMILSSAEPHILSMEPSGSVRSATPLPDNAPISFCAMGKDSTWVEEQVLRSSRRRLKRRKWPSSSVELEEFLISLVLQSRNEEVELVVEKLSAAGIERRLLVYKGGKQVSSKEL